MDGKARGTEEACADEVTSQQVYWAQVYERCHRRVRAYFARNVRCSHDVDDLVQEVFTNLIARGDDSTSGNSIPAGGKGGPQGLLGKRMTFF